MENPHKLLFSECQFVEKLFQMLCNNSIPIGYIVRCVIAPLAKFSALIYGSDTLGECFAFFFVSAGLLSLGLQNQSLPVVQFNQEIRRVFPDYAIKHL